MTTNTTTYTTNTLNQYTAITGAPAPTYDADGDTLTGLRSALSGFTCAWDAENRMLTATPTNLAVEDRRVECAYDALGRRVRKTAKSASTGDVIEDRFFIYDRWNVIEETVTPTDGATETAENVWGADLSGTVQGAGGVGGLLTREKVEVQEVFTTVTAALRVRSAADLAACENKSAALIATAQGLRRPFPEDFAFKPKAPLCDTVIFLRRTDETGRLVVLGRRYEVDAHWQHRLVRVEVDFTEQTMNFHSLRRAAPTAQPLLKTRHFQRADKPTKGVRADRDAATRGRRLDNKSRKP